MWFFRFILFCTVAFLCSTGWWVAIVPVALWYIYLFDGYELILLGALTDIHFSATEFLPYATLVLVGLVLVVYWIKPRLMVYTEDTNV